MYDHTDPRVTAEPCHPGTPPLAAEREHRSATVDAIAAARSHGGRCVKTSGASTPRKPLRR
jgi:hypothetical protein